MALLTGMLLGSHDTHKSTMSSFKDENHLAKIVEQAQEIVADALGSSESVLQEQEAR